MSQLKKKIHVFFGFCAKFNGYSPHIKSLVIPPLTCKGSKAPTCTTLHILYSSLSFHFSFLLMGMWFIFIAGDANGGRVLFGQKKD